MYDTKLFVFDEKIGELRRQGYFVQTSLYT